MGFWFNRTHVEVNVPVCRGESTLLWTDEQIRAAVFPGGIRVFLGSHFRSVELPDTFIVHSPQTENAAFTAERIGPEALLVPGCKCRLCYRSEMRGMLTTRGKVCLAGG